MLTYILFMYLLLIYLYMISLLDVISYFSSFHISELNRSSERFDLTSDSSHNLWMKFVVTFKEGLIKHIKEIENACFETKSNQNMFDIKVIY